MCRLLTRQASSITEKAGVRPHAVKATRPPCTTSTASQQGRAADTVWEGGLTGLQTRAISARPAPTSGAKITPKFEATASCTTDDLSVGKENGGYSRGLGRA